MTDKLEDTEAGTLELLAAAVHNNARWCDAVCRALGCDTALMDGLWVNRSPSPPYYSNAVTLVADAVDAQVGRVRSMLGGPLPRPWTIKDGFHALDLEPLGFQVLFEARWVGLDADADIEASDDGCVWAAVPMTSGSPSWEAAWRVPNDDVGTATPAAPVPAGIAGRPRHPVPRRTQG